MNHYLHCDERGRIFAVHGTGDTILPCAHGVTAETHYVEMRTKTVKPMQPQNIKAVGARVLGIKAPAAISIMGEAGLVSSQRVDTPEIEFRFDLPGVYRVYVDPDDPQWKTEQVTITIA